MAWKSPPWVADAGDPFNEWFNIFDSIDKNIESYARWNAEQTGWRAPLTFSGFTADCDKIRFYAKETNDQTNIQIRLEQYYDGEWHTVQIFKNLTETPTWYEILLNGGAVVENLTQFQLKFLYGGTYETDCYLYEVEYNEILPPPEKRASIISEMWRFE